MIAGGVGVDSQTQFTGGDSDAFSGVFKGTDFIVGSPYIYINSPVKLLLFGLAILLAVFIWLKSLKR